MRGVDTGVTDNIPTHGSCFFGDKFSYSSLLDWLTAQQLELAPVVSEGQVAGRSIDMSV